MIMRRVPRQRGRGRRRQYSKRAFEQPACGGARRLNTVTLGFGFIDKISSHLCPSLTVLPSPLKPVGRGSEGGRLSFVPWFIWLGILVHGLTAS